MLKAVNNLKKMAVKVKVFYPSGYVKFRGRSKVSLLILIITDDQQWGTISAICVSSRRT